MWLDAPAHVLSREERLYAVAFDELMKGHWVADSDAVRLVKLANTPAMPDVTLAGLATLAKFFGYGLWMYVAGPDGLIKNLTVPVLCFTATAFIFVRTILNKGRSDVVIAGLVTVFLPFIALAGAMEYRYSQALLVIGCVYLCASAAAVALLDKLVKPVWVSAIVVGLLSATILQRTTAEWRPRSVFLRTGTERLQIKTFHVFDDLGRDLSALVDGSAIHLATNNMLLGHFLSIKYGSKFILERMPLDYRDAGDWLSTHAPDRIAISTAQGVSAYPRAQFDSLPGFRSMDIIDKTGYGFLFFERKPPG